MAGNETLSEKISKLDEEKKEPDLLKNLFNETEPLEDAAIMRAYNILNIIMTAGAKKGISPEDYRERIPGVVSRVVDHRDPVLMYKVLQALLRFISNMSYNKDFILSKIVEGAKSGEMSKPEYLSEILFSAMLKED